MENEILRILPQTVRAVLLHTPESRIEELRLRVGQKPSVLYAGCEQILNAGGVLTQNELQQVLLNASAQSQYAVQEQLRNGYLSLPGGYRIGVCGSTVVQNGCITGIREISSIALRVPHDIRATARAAASISAGILSACRCTRKRENNAIAQLHPNAFRCRTARGRCG